MSKSRLTQHVVVEGLVRRFGSIVAVAGVDLTVDTGEVFGFLGPNGAGKSTMVRMLTTLLKPSEGRAFVAGHDVVARHKGPALTRFEKRRQHPDHCRFAGSVWSEKAEHLSGVDSQIDAGDGDDRAEAPHP